MTNDNRNARELFLSHDGVKIYHVYKDGFNGRAMDFWYCTSPDEFTDTEFDIRELWITPEFPSIERVGSIMDQHHIWETAVKDGMIRAIDAGRLTA